MSSRMNAVSDARAEAVLRGETHRYVYLLVAGRKLTQEKKKNSRAGISTRIQR